MAPAFCKENFNRWSPAHKDINQEQKETREPQVFAQKFVLGDMLRGFQSKEAEGLEGKKTVCTCKSDNSGSDGTMPWIDKIWKSVSGSLSCRGLPKQRSSDRVLEADTASMEKVSFKRRFRPQGKPKNMLSLEDHLLRFMLNHLHVKEFSLLDQDEGALHCKCGHFPGVIEGLQGLETKAYPVGVFLQAHPLENSNLAQGLTDGLKKASLQKQSTLGFARLQGELQILCSQTSHPEEQAKSADVVQSEESRGSPLRLHFPAFVDLIPGQQQQTFPNKERLSFVEDFFHYAETEGKRVFQELDRDKDGKLTVDDIRAEMHKMKLPSSYVKKFMHSRYRHWPTNSIGWTEFFALIQEKEPIMIRLFNSLGVSKHGTLQRSHVKNLLRKSSLPVTESKVTAMMKSLGGEEGSIKYGQFRRFMLLIPTEQLRLNPWSDWFNVATTGAESESGRGSVTNHATSLSKGLACQLEVAQAKVVRPYLRRVEEVSKFIKLRAKHVLHDPLTRVGGDALEIGGYLLHNVAAEVSRLQHVRSLRSKFVGPPAKSQLGFEESCLNEDRRNATQHSDTGGSIDRNAEEPSY